MKPGWRKFTVAMSILVFSTFLTYFAQLSGDNFRDIVIGVMGLFGLANVGEYFGSKK